MSDERERDAALVEKHRASWVFTMELNKRENIPDSVMTKDAQLVVALYRTIDRLSAERDSARAAIWSAYASLHSHLFTTVPVDAPNKMVEAYETLKAAYELSRAALESEVGE